MQLFLLHFAGGSVYSFDFLKKNVRKDVDFIPLELPGRGKRYHEELIKNKEEAINDYCNQIRLLRNGRPYLIYGHSMGATLGLSVAAKLEAAGDAPLKLIVSGNAGPGVKKEQSIIRYLLDDFEFKKELKELGGMPYEVLENNDLYNYFSPIMRADFECIEKYFFSEKGIQINTPIHAIMGSEENTSDKIENWKNFTTSDFEYTILKGNHFFIYDHPIQLLNIITNNSEILITK